MMDDQDVNLEEIINRIEARSKQKESKKLMRKGIEARSKRKESKKLMRKEFRERFGRAYRVTIRVPDDYVSHFLHLKNQLGRRKVISWLMEQAQPAINQLLLKPQPKQEPTRNTPTTYQVNEVWALWDEQVDGMPRSYARINKLLLHDLKIEVAFLEPVPITDDEIEWSVHNKLPMSCGAFKEAASTTTVEIYSFSHLVNIGEGFSVGNTFYWIYPRKGEVWAVFKDWNIKWTLHDFAACTRYDMVEVESCLYDEDGIVGVCDGIVGICLIRVGGVGAFFEKELQDGHVKHQRFSGKELLQFSHRVPVSKVTGESIYGVPSESWELDPAAVPLYLL